jgi:O-antigen/teichoic acid export membrane protein
MKRLFGSILRLGTGEAVSKLATFGLYAYISRAFGVELLGIVALSQTIATYVTLGTDQGLRLIGARLVARDASAAPVIMRHVLRKRLISCAVCVALGSAYALCGPVPASARYYVLGFVLAVIPYAFSLDWLVWGMDHFGWLGAWRGGVGLLFMAGAIAAIRVSGTTLLPITLANIASTVFGVIMLWAVWHFRWKSSHPELTHENRELGEQFRWGAVLPLGASTILILMFNNFDTVMLAAMTSAKEVGRYSAAYKILFVIFSGYYLLTQALYPKLSRMKSEHQTRRFLLYAVVTVTIIGCCLAIGIAIWASHILRMIYGADLNSVYLVRVLSLAIPIDFCTSLLGITLISRGFDRLVLACFGSSAVVNVLLNFYLIRGLHAEGCAWATVVSYAFLLVMLGAVFLMKFNDDRSAGFAPRGVSERSVIYGKEEEGKVTCV